MYRYIYGVFVVVVLLIFLQLRKLDQFLKIRLGWSELSIPARSLSR
jgi:hypothetical protein